MPVSNFCGVSFADIPFQVIEVFFFFLEAGQPFCFALTYPV